MFDILSNKTRMFDYASNAYTVTHSLILVFGLPTVDFEI